MFFVLENNSPTLILANADGMDGVLLTVNLHGIEPLKFPTHVDI
jgi:hypothetical protein